MTEENIAEKEKIKSSLDELFSLAKQYRTSKAFHKFIQFVGKFHFYSPFNAMLIHIQLPGARFLATPSRWCNEYGRNLKPNARPIVILQPRGPVMFVFDIADTEAGSNAKPLPPEVDRPFEVRGGTVGNQLDWLIENAKRDGVGIFLRKEGSQSAGSICDCQNGSLLRFLIKKDRVNGDNHISVPMRYELLMNDNLPPESLYATIAHELAHLYCGHLGTQNEKWWKGRRNLSKEIKEFEAESVAYILCQRLGIDNPSEKYLAGYVGNHENVPDVSLECILKAAGLVEQMGKKLMKARE